MGRIEKLIESLPDELWFNGQYYYFNISKKQTVVGGREYCITYCTNKHKHLYSINDISLKIALEKITEKLLEEGWSLNSLI